ncbi:MAG: hypothetical protein NVV73_13980 [Cellvibrionaceae bacterium]|nr:hypothetical protein [Cellvibrionaceae bacterium]
MKPVPTKAEMRAELERQIQDYLQTGGVVQDVPRGISGQVDNRNLFGAIGQNPPRQERTPVDEVVQALEARKHPHNNIKKNKRPRKKLLTDDFGEPLRWVWVED